MQCMKFLQFQIKKITDVLTFEFCREIWSQFNFARSLLACTKGQFWLWYHNHIRNRPFVQLKILHTKKCLSSDRAGYWNHKEKGFKASYCNILIIYHLYLWGSLEKSFNKKYFLICLNSILYTDPPLQIEFLRLGLLYCIDIWILNSVGIENAWNWDFKSKYL